MSKEGIGVQRSGMDDSSRPVPGMVYSCSDGKKFVHLGPRDNRRKSSENHFVVGRDDKAVVVYSVKNRLNDSGYLSGLFRDSVLEGEEEIYASGILKSHNI